MSTSSSTSLSVPDSLSLSSSPDHFINPIPPHQPHQPPPNSPSPAPTTFNPNPNSSSSLPTFNPNSPSPNPNPNQAEIPSQPTLSLPEITNLQQIIQHLSGSDFDEAKYAEMDILEIAEKKGIVFDNPSWWPLEEKGI